MQPSFQALAAAALLAAPAIGQIPLSGNVSDSTFGPLVSGNVYHVTGDVLVPGGSTLTVQPNVVVKFGFDRTFTVDGSLLVHGAGAGSVVFTDLRDDSVGGDTNGDGGASTPATNWWRGIVFRAGSDGSQVTGLTARYAGRFVSSFEFSAASPTLQQCRSEDCAGAGFDLNTSSFPALTGCASIRSMGNAFDAVPIAALAGFTNLTATGNTADRIRVSGGTVPAGPPIVIRRTALVDDQFFLDTNLTVPAGATLRMNAGAICKIGFDRQVTIDGTLDTRGNAANPVLFTDERDDAAGGDSNGDGLASAPAPNWWRGIQFRAGSDASVLRHTRVQFGGRFISGIELSQSSPTLRDCVVRDTAGAGVNLNANSRPTVDGLTVEGSSLGAIENCEVQALMGFTGVSLSGNGFDRIEVTSATIGAGESVTLRPSQLFMDTVFLNTSMHVMDGGTLTAEPGVIFKMAFDRTWHIAGQVHLAGSSTGRIVITDERDDSFGGDSNSDGDASMPATNWWRGLEFANTSDGSRMAFTDVRFGGRFVSGIEITNAQLTLDRCLVADTAQAGVDFNNSTEPCSVERLRVHRSGGPAIDRVRLERLQDIELASGTGNDQNTIRVTSGTLSEDSTIEPDNQFNGSVYCDASVTIPQGIELNLQPGVVMKMGFDRSVTVNGSLTVRGSLTNPATLTSFLDDSVGGDTNGDGAASQPASNWWRGVTLHSTTDTSIVIGLEVRYGGRFQPNIVCSSPLTAMREVRSTHSAGSGLRISAHAIPLERIVAWSNGADGIELTGGGFDVRQVTCANNVGVGIDAEAAYTGTVRDSILWSNAAGAEDGLGAGRIRFSNGGAALAGTNGNISADPLFADQANGDLRLTAGSPCINTGDPASPSDPDSTRADMGALFFNFCEPEIVCTQPMSFPPCEPVLTYSGFASLSSAQPFVLTLSSAPTNSFAIFFYGIGAPTTINGAFGDICVGGPYQRTQPVPSGGNPADGPCAGTFEFDFNAHAQAGSDPAIVAGVDVIGHLWYRYGAAPGNARFSDGIRIPICP